MNQPEPAFGRVKDSRLCTALSALGVFLRVHFVLSVGQMLLPEISRLWPEGSLHFLGALLVPKGMLLSLLPSCPCHPPIPATGWSKLGLLFVPQQGKARTEVGQAGLEQERCLLRVTWLPCRSSIYEGSSLLVSQTFSAALRKLQILPLWGSCTVPLLSCLCTTADGSILQKVEILGPVLLSILTLKSSGWLLESY